MDERSPTRLGDLLRELERRFSEAGIAAARVDAELLAAHVLGASRGRVQALDLLGRTVTAEEAVRIRTLGEDRAARVPLQHLTGRAAFRSLELSVGPGVFVPRPETESVVQFAIDELHGTLASRPSPVAIDLCTGSGAIALALAQEVPEARVIAVEMSPEAHAWAERNVDEWGAGRVELLRADITELDPSAPSQQRGLAHALEPLRGGVDVLISNPPYVPSAMVPQDPEVREHDPELALYSGEDGLDLIRMISRIGGEYVRAGGLLVLEHAETQGDAIRRLLARDGWDRPRTHPDLTGRDRTTTARAA